MAKWLLVGTASGRLNSIDLRGGLTATQFDKLTTNGKRGVPWVKETGIGWLLT